jgi:integrase
MSAQHVDTRRERVRPGVYRRLNPDGSTVYEIAYRDSDGRQRRESVGPKLKAAEARLAQVKADMSRGVRVARRRDLTVADAAATWLDSLGHLRPTTVSAYRSSLEIHLLPAFGRRRLEALTPDDVARWAQKATTLGYRFDRDRAAFPDPAGGPERVRPPVAYRARTVNIALTTLGRVYAHAIRRQGYAGTSPVAALERAERPTDEPKPMTVLTPEQLAAVIGHTAPPYRTVLAFLAGTGCRIGEALGLTWADVNLAHRTARIAMGLDRNGRRVPLKTRNGRRTLDLPGSLVTALAAHKLAAVDTTPSAFVFASVTGGPLDHRNVARRGLVAACKLAGVPVVSPHALRHAHASALLADGWDLPAVSRRLGHGTVAITASTYAHLLEDDERRRARRDRLDGLYGGGTVAAI